MSGFLSSNNKSSYVRRNAVALLVAALLLCGAGLQPRPERAGGTAKSEILDALTDEVFSIVQPRAPGTQEPRT